MCPFDEDEIVHYVRCYNEPDFAWQAATKLAKNDQVLPIFPSGSDIWFYRAWLLLRDPDNVRHKDAYAPIKEAWAWHYHPEHRPTRELLQALLICPGATIQRVAGALALPPDSVEAYECLFFNVIARHLDYLFLRNIVFPDTKQVEQLVGYLEKSNLGNILLRLGYEKSIEDVLYWGGVRQEAYHEGMTESQAMEEYQKQVLVNGVILARTGWLNYQATNAGLSNTRSLVSASKIGGQETSGGDDGLGDFATAARSILEKKRSQISDEAKGFGRG